MDKNGTSADASLSPQRKSDSGVTMAASLQQTKPIHQPFAHPPSFQVVDSAADPKIILSQQQQQQSRIDEATHQSARRRLPQIPAATFTPSPSAQQGFSTTDSTAPQQQHFTVTSPNANPAHINNTSPLAIPFQPPTRRASSPRMLPTPPPQPILPPNENMMTQPTNASPFSPSPSPPANASAVSSPFALLEQRRPSANRRLLPPEPPTSTSPSSNSLHSGESVVASLPPPAPSHLQRSASARTSTTANRAQLPPAPPRLSTTTANNFQTQSSSENTSMNRLLAAPDQPAAAHASTSSPVSTHTSPAMGLRSRGSMTEGSPSHIGARKFSTDLGRDLLSRNGSMAHLLEQQNLLRREFTATPDSMAAHSNNSSLSPSIEQLNCAVSTKSSSDGDDPSVHGLDPSLYGGSSPSATQTPTNSNSTHDIAGGTSHSVSSSALAQVSPAVNNENEPRPKGLGLIYCTLQHFPVRKRLRVSVLKIDGLAGELRPELELQPFCKVNILPAKSNKQQTSFVKRGRDVVFNQEFFFDGISSEDLGTRILFVEVFHQSTQKLQKDLEIGQIHVPLKDFTQLYSKKEVRIIEELKHRSNSKKLGKLYITTCIEAKEARLTINLIKVDDLQKWGIIGAPDVCVRISMSQGSGGVPQTKSSRVLKNTTTAVYKEAVMFLISTKKADLQNTKITISVHDVLRSVTGDDVIGSVYLGQLAIDKSEIEQWKNTIEHLGKEYKGCHTLKAQAQTEIHVSEEAEDEQHVEDE